MSVPDARILNLYNLKFHQVEFSSLTIKFRPTLNRIPEYRHFEDQQWMGRQNSQQNHWLLWPGNDHRSSRQSVYLEGNGPACGTCSSRPILLLKWEKRTILFSAEAILASSTSKFGIDIPRVDDEDLKSSTESTNSTSLIHCIASVGNCEQVHTSVLNLIFQQAKVAVVGNLSKWRSEICSRWSAP